MEKHGHQHSKLWGGRRYRDSQVARGRKPHTWGGREDGGWSLRGLTAFWPHRPLDPPAQPLHSVESSVRRPPLNQDSQALYAHVSLIAVL